MTPDPLTPSPKLMKTIKTTDRFALWGCNHVTGKDHEMEFGSGEEALKELRQRMNFLAEHGRDVWLIHPDGSKELPTVNPQDEVDAKATPSTDKAIYDARRWLDAVIHSGLNTIGREKVVELLARYDAARNPDAPSPYSPTPRTDAATWTVVDEEGEYHSVVCPKDMAVLERELAALVKEREEWLASTLARDKKSDEDRDAYESLIEELKAQLSAARTQCELRSAGHDDLRTKLNQANQAHGELTERYKRTHDHWNAAEERWAQVCATLNRVQEHHAIEVGDLNNSIDSLRAQLAETEGKLKEAEKCADKLAEHNGDLLRELLALQAHVEKLARYLDGIGHACGMGNLQAVELLTAEALRARPDLPLIEEVREVLENVRGFEVIGERCRKRIDSILARLNPAKL